MTGGATTTTVPETENVRVTSGAALKVSLPDCDPRTLTTPVPVMRRVVPVTVAGPLTTANETGAPELAVATRGSEVTVGG